MDPLAYIVTAVGAYLLGSIPTGFLVAKARGVDIRAAGSGNIGATNAFRVLGAAAGSFVLIVDGLKGYAASAWLAGFVHDLLGGHGSASAAAREGLMILAAIAAILGHNYTCWLKFKGGKGIATSAGAFFALAPLAAGIALSSWVVVFVTSRFVSVASLAASVALPAAVWFSDAGLLFKWVTTAAGVLAIYKHKSNIERLLAGTESRVNFSKKDDSK